MYFFNHNNNHNNNHNHNNNNTDIKRFLFYSENIIYNLKNGTIM